jgi:hypothetical protein
VAFTTIIKAIASKEEAIIFTIAALGSFNHLAFSFTFA